ncbi:DNA-binding XRE family transcriptional regulator [Dysgonomonas alginatilytica]|uniref:DNA-binding XRE family transcriptional regulator n=1 Tax=Dysgonomonas alginatilytica TaxID=1605892 RepID=A0A2V3PVX8_9BACT|nr:helix-turn-helix transcriptional regulator [Dysgonomonas alginatilytica]PXV68954.1 DNA-binding XRE family transcriptional regulator [Dysgonomonas alginatilytica]
MNTSFETKKRNDGYSVKRLREILGVKQEDLADKLQVSQQTISKIEQKDILEDELLNNIAKALNVSVEAIKNFSDEAAINIIANTFQDEAVSYAIHYKCTFNPLDKVIELYDGKIELLERMLKAEQEKVNILEQMLKDKK